MRTIQWNIDGAGGRGERTACTDLQIPPRRGAVRGDEVRQDGRHPRSVAWCGTRMDPIHQTRGGHGTKGGGGHTNLPRPGVFGVDHVYDEVDQPTNSVIKALKIELSGGRLINNTYILPGSPSRSVTSFLDSMIRNGSNASWLIGDMNAHTTEWDTTNNQRGKALLRRIRAKNCRVMARKHNTGGSMGRSIGPLAGEV